MCSPSIGPGAVLGFYAPSGQSTSIVISQEPYHFERPSLVCCHPYSILTRREFGGCPECSGNSGLKPQLQSAHFYEALGVFGTHASGHVHGRSQFVPVRISEQVGNSVRAANLKQICGKKGERLAARNCLLQTGTARRSGGRRRGGVATLSATARSKRRQPCA